MRQMKINTNIKIGLIILGFLIFIAVFAGYLSPYDPNEKELSDRLISPCLTHPFGTDNLGRDIFTRILYGTRTSLAIGGVVVGASLAIGVTLGLIAGWYGGYVDEILMRIVDGFLAFPSIFLAIGFVVFLGQGFLNLTIALVLVEWTVFARVARGSILNIRKSEYFYASRQFGAGELYLIFRHALPNILSPLIVIATLSIGNVILAAAGLSFLGIGVQPSVPEWGNMLNEGRMFFRKAPYLMFFPGMMIMLTVLAFNILGDGLRDSTDTRDEEIQITRNM